MHLRASKQCVKAVTFDLWETLLLERDGWGVRRAFARCRNLADVFQTLGVEVSVEKVNSALKETISSLLKVWDTNRDVTHLDQIRLIVKHVSGGSAVAKDEWISSLSSAYVSGFFEVPPYLNPDAYKVLQWLKSRKMLIGLICNIGLTPGFALRRFLEDQGVAEYFDVMIFSDEVGVRKPDPRIFHLASKKFKVKPCDVVHVGDNLKSDVWGAKNAGFKAIYFSCVVGRDRIAESDPASVVSLSRKLGNLKEEEIVPDATVISLSILKKVIRELET